LAKIALGEPQDSFAYPDLARWSPPLNQSDAVGRLGEGLALVGLGPALPLGDVFASRGDGVWQWLRLSFGQTVLAKRRQSLRSNVRPELLPDGRRPVRPPEANRPTERTESERTTQRSLPLGVERTKPQSLEGTKQTGTDDNRASRGAGDGGQGDDLHHGSLDAMTDEAIRSNFDDRVLGHLFNRCIDQYESIESAIAFASVVAKARLARRRRGRQP
jgi:hypothetical protein